MRPTPAETIEGIRRVLRDVVEPEVGSEYARARLREVRAVLAQVDWDDAGLALARDNTALHRLLVDCRDWIASNADRRAHFGRQLAELGSAAADAPSPDDEFAVHNKRHAKYAARVVELVDPLTDWVRTHPDDQAARSLRRRLLSHPG